MIIEDLLLRSSLSLPLIIVVNNKFTIRLVPEEFYRYTYKDILKKYVTLPIIYADKTYIDVYGTNIKKYYVESKQLEKDLIDFENNWYDKNRKFIKKKEGELLWISPLM